MHNLYTAYLTFSKLNLENPALWHNSVSHGFEVFLFAQSLLNARRAAH